MIQFDNGIMLKC